jgi:hypothetical protein
LQARRSVLHRGLSTGAERAEVLVEALPYPASGTNFAKGGICALLEEIFAEYDFI